MDTEVDPEKLLGEVLASRYRIEALLGHGAMGTVFRARHVKVGRPFAVKVLHPRLLTDDKVQQRFAREAELAGSLNHPNVVSVVDVGETAEGLRYMVMEFADGSSLYELIKAHAPMPSHQVISIVRQLLAGLEHAHDGGLIHRDFKPENVIVERGDEVDTMKIVDFGVAILREDAADDTSKSRLTTAGLVLGTPLYMAPEHALGAPIDHRIDLFALGVMCFEMLTGAPPYDGDGVDVARANLLLDTPIMAVRVPGLRVDPLLEALTRKLMSKSRDDRPANASEALELLDLIERDRAAAAVVFGIKLDDAPAVAPTFRGRIAVPESTLAPPMRAQQSEPAGELVVVRQASWTRRLAAAGGIAAALAIAAVLTLHRGGSDEPSLAVAPPSPRPAALSAPAREAPAVALAVEPHPEPPGPALLTPPSSSPTTVDDGPASAPGLARGIDRPVLARLTLPPNGRRPAAPAAPTAPAAVSSTRNPAGPVTSPTSGQAVRAEPVAASPVPEAPPPAPPPQQPAVAVAPAPAAATASGPATAARVAQLYAAVGQQLKAFDQARGSASSSDLWPLYLRIRINEVIGDPAKREEANTLLHEIHDQLADRSR